MQTVESPDGDRHLVINVRKWSSGGELEPEKGKGKARVVVLGFFFCLANKALARRTKIKIASNSTSYARNHLEGLHSLTFKATEQIQHRRVLPECVFSKGMV